MRRPIRAAVAALALAAPVAAQAADRAVVVGIGAYPNLDAAAQLRSPAAEALRFRRLAIDMGWVAPDGVTTLLNAAATSDAIIDAFTDTLIAQTEPGDRAIFYFSGHGTRIDDENGDEPDGLDEALVTADYGQEGARGGLVDDVMDQLFARLTGRDVMVVIDACHSGTATRSGAGGGDARRKSIPALATRRVGRRNASPKTAAEAPIAAASGRAVWSAAGPAQLAWEDAEGGVFTRYFVRGLADLAADANANGQVTGAELLDYVRTQTAAWCAANRGCREEGLGFTPHHEGGAADLARPYAVAAAGPTAGGGDGGGAAGRARRSPSDLLGAGNDAALSIRFADGPRLRIGQQVSLLAHAQRDGALIVFDVNPDGAIHQLSPSRLSRPDAGRLSAGTVARIPELFGASGRGLAMEVAPPSGSGAIVALLIEDDVVDVAALSGANLTLAPVPDAERYLLTLAESLRRMRSEAGVNRAVRWSAAYLDYTIEP